MSSFTTSNSLPHMSNNNSGTNHPHQHQQSHHHISNSHHHHHHHHHHNNKDMRRKFPRTFDLSQIAEDPMDIYLDTMGLWKKRIARDGSCLFRAVAEQV